MVAKRERLEFETEPIWEKQPGETDKQFMWFVRYKDAKLAGGTSFVKLCQEFNRKPSYVNALNVWSSKNRWRERITAYRNFLEEEKHRLKLKSFDEMNTRHIKSSELLQNIFATWLSANRDKIESLKPETALRFFDVGAKLERLAIGAENNTPGQFNDIMRTAKNMIRTDADHEIVDIQEFVESRYYMNQKDYVRPKILEKLWEIFHGQNSENNLEIVLGGGIGWGKSFMAEMGLAYMIYKLSCYSSPQIEFGLAPGSSMYFIVQSATLELAKKVVFGQLSQRLRKSEYFSKHFPYDKTIMSELRFPNNISVLPLSGSDTAALGMNVFGGCLDELNFMSCVSRPTKARFTGEQEYDQAEKLYTTVVRRMKSRFNDRGKVPGKLFLISSANYPGDFIDRKIKEAEAEVARHGKSNIFVVRYPQWGTIPEDRLSEGHFLVEVGDETRNSRIVETKAEAVDPDKVIEIPIDYKKEFEADIEAAIRDVAGVPVGGVSAFIKNRETIEKAAKSHAALYSGRQLFTSSSIDILNFRDRLEDLINQEYLEDLSLQSNLNFCASVDLALTGDSCGVAIGHFSGYKTVGKSTEWDEDQKSYIERPAGDMPIVTIDGLLEIVPPKADEIDINLVGDLLELINSRIMLEIVSADSFQSAALLQRMRRISNLGGRRIKAGVVSVDTSIVPYTDVKNALKDERLIFPDMAKAKKELRELMFDTQRRKIDHPVKGSKDVSDALAACSHIIMNRNMTRRAGQSVSEKFAETQNQETAPYQEPAAARRVRPKGRGHRVF